MSDLLETFLSCHAEIQKLHDVGFANHCATMHSSGDDFTKRRQIRRNSKRLLLLRQNSESH